MARILSPTNDYWLSAFEGDLYDVYACSRFMEILYMSIQYHKIQHNGNLIMSFLQSPEVHTFIHSFILAISIAPPSSLLLLRGAPDYSTNTVSEFHAEATVGKGLAQGPCVAARAGVEPTTLRLKVIASTNAPPRPTTYLSQQMLRINAMLKELKAFFLETEI